MIKTKNTEGEKNMTPNVEQIRSQSQRIIRSRIPGAVRKELMQGVKDGLLGRIKKDGLLPEIFFHPDHIHTARETRKEEAEYSINLIKNVFV